MRGRRMLGGQATGADRMTLSDAQRFIYCLFGLAYFTIFVLVLLNVYALEIFLVLSIAEFFAVVQLTEPSFFRAAWRKHMNVLAAIYLIIFFIVMYRRILSL
ncbi:MAG: hypothetical protein WCE82_01735 [Halobacteriota archaeon]